LSLADSTHLVTPLRQRLAKGKMVMVFTFSPPASVNLFKDRFLHRVRAWKIGKLDFHKHRKVKHPNFRVP
jgi:hypothetical protein